jgi:hypothetical protein
MNSIEKINFLDELGQKTVIWQRGESSGISEFTKYNFTKNDFKKIQEIIKDEFLLVLPKENTMGLIDGYDVHDLQGKLLLRFGEPNLPKDCGYTLEKLFKQLVRSEQNVEIHKQLKGENKIQVELQETFAAYCCS